MTSLKLNSHLTSLKFGGIDANDLKVVGRTYRRMSWFDHEKCSCCSSFCTREGPTMFPKGFFSSFFFRQKGTVRFPVKLIAGQNCIAYSVAIVIASTFYWTCVTTFRWPSCTELVHRITDPLLLNLGFILVMANNSTAGLDCIWECLSKHSKSDLNNGIAIYNLHLWGSSHTIYFFPANNNPGWEK